MGLTHVGFPAFVLPGIVIMMLNYPAKIFVIKTMERYVLLWIIKDRKAEDKIFSKLKSSSRHTILIE